MGHPLAPPRIQRIDGVVYTFASPLESNRAAWTLAAMIAAALFSGGSIVGLALVGLAMLAVLWNVDRSVELVVGLHRLEVRTRRLGWVTKTTAHPWHGLSEASLEGRQIVLLPADGAPERLSAWGPLAQLAWVVGAINAQIRRSSAPLLTNDVLVELGRLEELVGASRKAERSR